MSVGDGSVREGIGENRADQVDARGSSTLEVKAVIDDSGFMAGSAARDEFDWHVDGLTAGAVAKRMRIAASAVRYYADQGLLPHDRTPSNQRRFHADVLCRVAMIQVAQRVGLSLAEIRDALTALPPGQVPTAEDWQHLAERLKRSLHGRIDEMFKLLNDLTNDMAASPSTRDADAAIALPVRATHDWDGRRQAEPHVTPSEAATRPRAVDHGRPGSRTSAERPVAVSLGILG